MMRILLTCPERKLAKTRESIMSEKDENGEPVPTIAISVASADVHTLQDTISAIEREAGEAEILVVAHSNEDPEGQCGGMGVIQAELEGGEPLSPETSESLVKQFKNREYKDRRDLEVRVNKEVQEENVTQRFDRVVLEGTRGVVVVDTPPDGYHGQKTLLIGRPTMQNDSEIMRMLGKDPKATYPVRALFPEEIASQIPIFVGKMGIRDIIILPENDVPVLRNVGPTAKEFEERVRASIAQLAEKKGIPMSELKIVSPTPRATPSQQKAPSAM